MILNGIRIAVITVIIFWILLTYCSSGWINSVKGYEIGNRKRLIAVLRLECFMTLQNIFIYGQLMYWFDHQLQTASKCEERTIQLSRRRWSNALIVLSALAQIMYYMYYAPEWLQWVLFDATTIAGGVWTNLVAFVSGFFLVNFLAPYFVKFPPTRVLLEFLGKWHFLRSLIWDRFVQIKFTLVITIVLSLAMFISSDMVVVKKIEIEVPNLSAKNGELRLAIVSDIHAGASVYRHQVEEVIDKLLWTPVDAILIVGDMVDGSVADLETRVEPFWILPKRFPTYFVTGNHEYYYGNVEEWLDLYKKNGIHVLSNSHEMLKGVCLAGVNDLSSGKMGITDHYMNVSNAINNCPRGATRILMTHNPASVLDFPKEDLQTIDVIFSGHTHAGQFYVVVPIVYWMLPYFYGLYDLGMSKLMVSAGTLYQGPPMKMLGMSEIWEVTLVSQK